jgi:putative nucleotidyltransferase with HDIG domain
MIKAKKRILFVDDEHFVLKGLERMLHVMRDEWEMEFVDNGRSALERMEQVAFDVIVSDMRMPRMNGAELLNEVMLRHPRTVRLILSGHADRELILRCVGATHQYLSKPCDAAVLKATMVRATGLEGFFRNEQLTSLVARIGTLPSLPLLYTEIIQCLQSPEVSMEEVGAIVEKDLAMTAKILKLVNSAFFGLARPICSPAEAASYLGADILKALVLSAHLFAAGEPRGGYGLSAEELWSHSLQTAHAAKTIAQSEHLGESIMSEAFVAGLLHDVGKLVLASNFPEEYRRVTARRQLTRRSAREVELEIFGSSHAEIGGYLLGLWGLPVPVVEAVALHHSLSAGGRHGFTALAAVHIADCLVQPAENYPVDLVELEKLGIGDRLAQWREVISESPVHAG